MADQQFPQFPQPPQFPGQTYPPSSSPSPPSPPPQFPSQPGPFSPSPQSLAPRTNHRRSQILIAVGLVAALVAGGVFSYFWYFIPPEKVVQAAMKKIVETESSEYAGQADFELDASAFIPLLSQIQKFSVDFSGVSDWRDTNNPKESFNLRLGKAGVEVIGVGDIAYLKVNNLSNSFISFFDFLGDLRQLDNQWIKIDPEEVRKDFVLGEKVEVVKDEKLTADEKERIKEAFLERKLLKVTAKLPAEKVGGVITHHYRYTVDKDELAGLFEEIDQIASEKPLTDDNREFIEKGLGIIEGELWIGKRDFRLYKIVLDLNLENPQEFFVAGKIRLLTQFKNHNKPVQIDIPSSPKSVEEVLTDLGGANKLGLLGLGSLGDFWRDWDSDRDGLSDYDEALYNTNPTDPDSDDDGHKDGEEIEKAFNPSGPGRLLEKILRPREL